jgi:hypothetical protein
VVFQYHDGYTGELLYAESVLLADSDQSAVAVQSSKE